MDGIDDSQHKRDGIGNAEMLSEPEPVPSKTMGSALKKKKARRGKSPPLAGGHFHARAVCARTCAWHGGLESTSAHLHKANYI